MTKTNGDTLRREYFEKVKTFLESGGEQTVVTGVGSVAFPVVTADGEEGWVEMTVKIPKWTDDDDGYSREVDYQMKVANAAQVKARREAEKVKKAAEREAKKAAAEVKKKAAEATAETATEVEGE